MTREIKQQYRNFSLPIESMDEYILEGYAAVFDVDTDLGYCTEAIAKNAFRESIDGGADVRALFNHNPDHVLARSKANTLVLSEDEHGLKVKILLDKENTFSANVFKMVKRGDVTQMSIGFFIESENHFFNSNKPHFIITKAELKDVSPVTFPAYTQTEISARGENDNILASRLDLIKNYKTPDFEYRHREININRFFIE